MTCVTCSQRYYLSHNTALVKLLKRLGHRSVPQWLKDDLSDTVTAWHHSRIVARCLIGTEGLVIDWQRYVHSLASVFWSSSSVDIKMTFRFRALPGMAGLSVNSAAQLSACVLFVHERYFNDDRRDRWQTHRTDGLTAEKLLRRCFLCGETWTAQGHG